MPGKRAPIPIHGCFTRIIMRHLVRVTILRAPPTGPWQPPTSFTFPRPQNQLQHSFRVLRCKQLWVQRPGRRRSGACRWKNRRDHPRHYRVMSPGLQGSCSRVFWELMVARNFSRAGKFSQCTDFNDLLPNDRCFSWYWLSTWSIFSVCGTGGWSWGMPVQIWP